MRGALLRLLPPRAGLRDGGGGLRADPEQAGGGPRHRRAGRDQCAQRRLRRVHRFDPDAHHFRAGEAGDVPLLLRPARAAPARRPGGRDRADGAGHHQVRRLRARSAHHPLPPGKGARSRHGGAAGALLARHSGRRPVGPDRRDGAGALPAGAGARPPGRADRSLRAGAGADRRGGASGHPRRERDSSRRGAGSFRAGGGAAGDSGGARLHRARRAPDRPSAQLRPSGDGGGPSGEFHGAERRSAPGARFPAEHPAGELQLEKFRPAPPTKSRSTSIRPSWRSRRCGPTSRSVPT